MTLNNNREPLFGKTLAELAHITDKLSHPSFRAAQIADWLYKKHVFSIDDMSNLPAALREELKASYDIGTAPPTQYMESADGTVKYLFSAGGMKEIEAVWIPEETRGTLCVSTQVGCKMACTFCMTGRQGFNGHLGTSSILNQYAMNPYRDNITNIVYMGMGEPLDNPAAVLKSLEIFTSDWGYGKSPTRITVSTIGVFPGLKRFLDESRCHLAVSLHSPFDAERESLMPVQKTWPAGTIIELLKQYDWRGQRKLSFEYILFDGVNDSEVHAKALVSLVSGLNCRINLLQYHTLPDSELRGSPRPVMERFQNILKAKGITATIRKSRGEDILAACGLLSTRKFNDS